MWNVYRADTARTVATFASYLAAEDWIAAHSGVAYGIILDFPL
jgi:hypothetical protein